MLSALVFSFVVSAEAAEESRAYRLAPFAIPTSPASRAPGTDDENHEQ